MVFLQAFVLLLLSTLAPFVCLFYRKGIWLTPDDPVSPFGCGTTPGSSREDAMVEKYQKWGVYWADWWWLGIRNSCYGLAYKWKPSHFKDLTTYANCAVTVTQRGPLRAITVDGFREWTVFLGLFHVIAGYRLRPVADEAQRNVPCRTVNMDARPILSIRAGGNDD